MPRKTSPRVATSKGCLPLLEMYQAAEKKKPSRWTEVETDFVNAMWAFDQNFTQGVADQGDNQNGKGDFFTDLIALLLENCSGKSLHGRGYVAGLVVRKHALDCRYPEIGTPKLLVETKVLGAPKTKRNPLQKNEQGRMGSADLDKRVKELCFKTIDLKAEWARIEGKGGGPTSDLLTWLKSSEPRCFLFLAVRVLSENDFNRAVEFADIAEKMNDGVGLVAYMPKPEGGYKVLPMPTRLELDRTLTRVGSLLRALE